MEDEKEIASAAAAEEQVPEAAAPDESNTHGKEPESPKKQDESSPEAGKKKKAKKRRRKKFRFVMAVITLVFAGLAGVSFYFAELLRDKKQECLMTLAPSGLSAEDTVKQYFKYWDEGNNEGMNQLALPDENQDPIGRDESFNLGLCYFCDIKLTKTERLNVIAEGYEGCSDSAVISVDFTYYRKFGFGDKTIPEINKNWEFYVAKINEGDDYRIINVVRP